jgi:hypothetical protein
MSSTSSSNSFVDQMMFGLASWATSAGEQAVRVLVASFGNGTEPDFQSILSVYDRMLAIALLLTGAVITFGLIERILGGSQGLGWNVIPRTLVAVFFAFVGLEVVEYIARYAALLATTWSPDLLGVSAQLHTLGQATLHTRPGQKLPMGSVAGLILTAFLTTFMALVVYLELVMRAALMLTVTAFIPLVCVMSIWPRLAGAATHLGEFMVGLLLSKFVIATTIYIGYGMVLPGVAGTGTSQQADWMVTGLAILFIAAFSPVVLVQGLRFTHSAAGTLVRGWGATAVSLIPWASAVNAGQGLLRRPGLGQAGRSALSRVPNPFRRSK